MPVPSLVSESVPVPFCATPEKVVLVSSPPTVSATAPATPLVTVPTPASEPTVSLKPFRFRVPVNVKAVASGSKSAFCKRSVPALMVVAPVYVEAVVPRASVPAPSLVSGPVPLIPPVSRSVPAPPMFAAEESVTAPESDAPAPVPCSAPAPATPMPVIDTASAPIATLLMFSVAPLATVVPPAVVPSAAALLAVSVPASTLVAPVYVFAPERVSVPVLSLVSDVPVPLITPLTVDAPPTLMAMAPPLVASAPMVAAPVVVMLSAPPAVVIVSPAFMVKTALLKETAFPPPWARLRLLSARLLMVIVPLACSKMLVVAAMPSSSDSNIVVGEASPDCTVPITPDGPPANELFSASVSLPSPTPFEMVMFTGSSSRLPVRPLGARVSTRPLNVSVSLPDTSTLPPSPDAAPPRALIAP